MPVTAWRKPSALASQSAASSTRDWVVTVRPSAIASQSPLGATSRAWWRAARAIV